MKMGWKAIGCVAVVLGLAGCRPEPGNPDYASQEEFDFDAIGEEVQEILEGPNPFVEGEQRLSLGVFYEGGASQTYIVDDVTRHFYIYGNEFTNVPTFAQSSSADRVEGVRADEIEHLGDSWWGGGIHWDNAQSLEDWSVLHISLKSTDGAFSEVELSMEYEGTDGEVSGNTSFTVMATDFGYQNDGTWHHLEIPLSVFEEGGINLGLIRIPLRLSGKGGDGGEVLLVDDLYLEP